MTKIQIFGCVVGVLVVFFSGYRYAASIYEAEMAEMVADYERQARSSAQKEAWGSTTRSATLTYAAAAPVGTTANEC